MVDELAVEVMLDADGDQPTARQTRLDRLTRLSVQLQEAGDEAAILRTLDFGLREVRLSGFAGRLEPDGQSLLVVQVGWRPEDVPAGEASTPGRQVRRLSMESSPTISRIIQTRETLFSAEIPSEMAEFLPRHATNLAQSATRSQAENGISVPMIAYSRTVGFLTILGERLERTDLPVVQTLGDHLAVALEKTTVLADLKRALLREHVVVRQLERLEALLGDIAAEGEPDAILRRVAIAIADALDVERVGIYATSRADPEMDLAASVSLSPGLNQTLAHLARDPGGGPLARVVNEGVVVIVEDLRSDQSWAPLLATPEADRLRSIWAAPLISRQGERLGALVMFPAASVGPTDDQLDLLRRYAAYAALATARSRLQDRETQAARNATIREMARTIPHEFGQPLAIISGYAELIAEGLLEDEPLREACQDLVAAAGTLADVVQRIERALIYAAKEYGPGRSLIDLERAAGEQAEADSEG